MVPDLTASRPLTQSTFEVTKALIQRLQTLNRRIEYSTSYGLEPQLCASMYHSLRAQGSFSSSPYPSRSTKIRIGRWDPSFYLHRYIFWAAGQCIVASEMAYRPCLDVHNKDDASATCLLIEHDDEIGLGSRLCKKRTRIIYTRI
ncbi:hypothetical protein H9L39_10464 [Fusarium oxysporum f. sp. albedinis]|nr:hypothetical protein H9L39_10464 [Fusarium oxysporum f. sp. albedinis]